MFGIRMNGWKYVEGLGSGGFTIPDRITPVPGNPEGQLYHIDEDPLETRNLYDQFPEKVREMQNELSRLRNSGRSR